MDAVARRQAAEALLRATYPSGGSSGGETTGQVTFAFDSPSPILLQAVAPGQILNRSALQIVTPFDDPSALVEFGTTTAPDRVLSFHPTDALQFESRLLEPIDVPDFLILTIHPGASTTGGGVLVYKIK